MRVQFIVVALTAGSVLLVSGASAARQVEASGQDPERCVGYMDGAQTPQLVPDSYAWSELWHLADSASHGSAAARKQLIEELGLNDQMLDIVLVGKARAVTGAPADRAAATESVRSPFLAKITLS